MRLSVRPSGDITNRRVVALDIETACNKPGCSDPKCRHGLDYRLNKITVAAISDGASFNKIFRGPQEQIVQDIKAFVEEHDLYLTAHYGKFDFGTIAAKGVDLTDRWVLDSHLLAFNFHKAIPDMYLSDYSERRRELNKTREHKLRDAGAYSLKTLAPYFLDVEPFWEPDTGYDNDEYVLKDVQYTAQLTAYFIANMHERSLEFVLQRHLPWTKNLLQMELDGISIDIGLLKSKWGKTNEELNDIDQKIKTDWSGAFNAYRKIQEEALREKYDDMRARAKSDKQLARVSILENNALNKLPSLNIDSPAQLAWLLRDYFGFSIHKLEDDDVESTDRETLERLAKQSPEIALLVKRRKLTKLATAFFPEYMDYQQNGIIHTTFNSATARTGRLSSSNPNCLSPDTKILTDKGFIEGYEIIRNKHKYKVAQYNKTDGKISFTSDYKTVYKEGTQLIPAIYNEHINVAATEDHRLLQINRKTGKAIDRTIATALKDARILHGGITLNKGSLDPNKLRLLIAIQADAELSGNSIRFVFKKERKTKRLMSLLELMGVNYYFAKIKNSTCTEIKIDKSKIEFDGYIDENKNFTDKWLQLDASHLIIAIEELNYWDGLFTRKESGIMYTSKHRVNCEIMAAAMCLVAYRPLITTSKIKGVSYYRLWGTRRNHSGFANIKRVELLVDYVWCVTVPTSYIITEREGKIQVIGNCQQVPGDLHDLFIARPGHLLVTKDLSAIEPTVLGYFSEDPNLCTLLINQGDFHSTNAVNAFNLNCDPSEVKKAYPEYRQVAKLVGLAVLYGAGAKRVTYEMRKAGFSDFTESDGKRFVDRLREFYNGVWKFKLALDRELERGGTLYNLLGRPFRIKHRDDVYMKGLNTLIQGSASDILQEAAYEVRLKGYKPLLLVHDEMVVEVPEEQAEEAEKTIVNTMTKRRLVTKHGNIPIRVEGKVDKKWSK